MNNRSISHKTDNPYTYFRKTNLWIVMLVAVFVLVGCQAGVDDTNEAPPTFVAYIVSDVDADGDIAFTPPNTFTISPASTTGTVISGIDPADIDEYRGFLNFPLRGSSGVPYGAIIESASLELFISAAAEDAPGAGVPFIMDLISFQPPVLLASDFDRTIQPPLLSALNDVYLDDVGFAVVFDITALMVAAQEDGLGDLQIRMLLDQVFEDAGIFEIEDDVIDTAPLLTVTYY